MQGLETCGGREAAGLGFMKRMKTKSDDMQSPPSPRWWVEQMANTLRDEDGGICFRNRYGFCSTGSQISWLRKSQHEDSNVEVASHFFTGASDPLCGTPYKLFRFSDPMPNINNKEEGNDHGTNKLWDLWRTRALSRTTLNKSLGNQLSNMEDDNLALLESISSTGTQKQSTFAEMVNREIELLENGVA